MKPIKKSFAKSPQQSENERNLLSRQFWGILKWIMITAVGSLLALLDYKLLF